LRAAITGCLIVACLIAIAATVYGVDLYRRPGPLTGETVVVVPKGASVAAIAQRLFSEGVIASPLLFRIGARMEGVDSDLRAGEYLLPAGISIADVVAMLRQGRVLVRRLTVPEGLTSAQVVDLVRGIAVLEGEPGEVPAEGTLLPETYHYSTGENRRRLIERMAAAMDETVRALWADRAPDLPLESREEAVALASIVEKETALAEERPRVAAVFLNRLRLGMRLQADPTVVYGLAGPAGSLNRPLTQADLQTPTPYNTYLIDGLPPGPIANPGRAAITAVLRPIASEELYFVADGSGGHAFARTLDEHNRNVARWRAQQRGALVP
jgi:UPF0755 protein